MQDKKALALRGVWAGAVSALIACGLYFYGSFEALEYQLYDRDFRITPPPEEAPSEIVIVAIDEPSLRRIGSWPWPRAYHAEVLRQIRKNGAKVIGVDMGFYEPDRRDPLNDQELVAATREAGNVVYPVVLEQFQRDGESLVKVMEPLPELTEAAAGLGHAHIESSADGIVRKVHLAYRTPERNYWGLNLEILRIYLGLPEEAIREVRPGLLAIGDLEMPVLTAPEFDSDGTRITTDYEMHISYLGDRETFEYVPAYKLIEGEVTPNAFAGKIVLYGGKAAGLYDDHMTPFSESRTPMPGVEIQANVLDSILKERSIQRAPLWMLSLVTALAAMGAAVLYQLVDTRLAAMLMVVLTGCTIGAHVLLFRAGYWMEVSPILVSLVLALIFGLMLKMRQVNVALDSEVLNLTEAAALTERAGDKMILETFAAAEPTLRDILGVPAAALLKLDRGKGILILTAQYGLSRVTPREKTTVKISGDLTRLLVNIDPMEIDGLAKHPLGALVPRNQVTHYHSLMVPLLSKGETVGALALFRPKVDDFREEERELLLAVSAEFGTLWYNASLYGKLTEKRSNPLATFTYKSQERRIQTLNVLSDAVLGEKSLMASIMDSIADGVVVTDVLGTIKVLNPKAKEILGLYGESAVGQSAVDFVRRFEDVPDEVIRERFKRIVERGETFSSEIRLSIPATRFYTLHLGPVKSRDGLVRGIVGVLSDITELKEMDQMKTDLMSMVTHEIRTPLATVRGFAQILLKGGIGTDKSKEFLEIINRQSNRLVNLVNDFLDITRIESGRQVITKGPVDMDRLIQNAVADLKPLADEKNISIQYMPPPTSVPEIFGDRNLIEQVLINLLSNAIKYSPKGAWARVAVAQKNGALSIAVQDNGLGIPKESLPRLFEKFYRVRCDDRKDIIGTGLGLSLVKQIIDLHQGTIKVESEHGKGSTFTFTMPVLREGMEPMTMTKPSVLSGMAASSN